MADGFIPSLSAFVDSSKRTLKQKLADLLSNPLPYLQQTAGQVNEDAKSFNRMSLAAALGDPMAKSKLRSSMLDTAMNFAPAMTVWHGSPHKFSKFDMSKIGTGEGAQAYGHGLYMAESPEVAKSYSKLNPTTQVSPNRIFQGVELVPGSPEYHAGTLLERTTLPAARKEVASWIAGGHPDTKVLDGWKVTLDTLNKATKKSDFKVGKNENLYKSDIPDEAVARFLDWDKPLSQQAPEVKRAFDPYYSKVREAYETPADPGWGDLAAPFEPTGKDLLDMMRNRTAADESLQSFMSNGLGPDSSAYLRSNGVPGIRYLDGGSRSAGQGSSNFVLFDDQLPRILEINGAPTGLQPWKPGEWK